MRENARATSETDREIEFQARANQRHIQLTQTVSIVTRTKVNTLKFDVETHADTGTCMSIPTFPSMCHCLATNRTFDPFLFDYFFLFFFFFIIFHI